MPHDPTPRSKCSSSPHHLVSKFTTRSDVLTISSWFKRHHEAEAMEVEETVPDRDTLMDATNVILPFSY